MLRLHNLLLLSLLGAGISPAFGTTMSTQTGAIVTPLPPAAANAGLTFWTYGTTSTDCASGVGTALVACASDGTAWNPKGRTFQGDSRLGISDHNGVIQFATAGPTTLTSGQGVCISNASPPVASLCYAARQFVYAGTNDVLTQSDCGGAVIYSVDPIYAQSMNVQFNAAAVGLGTLQNCDVLLVNQSPFVVVVSPDTTQSISSRQSIAIPPTKAPYNPYYLEVLSDGSQPGAWIVGRNNILSPLNIKQNGVNMSNQFRLNLQAGSSGMSLSPQADGATVNVNGLDIRYNGTPSSHPLNINLSAGTNMSVTPDAQGGVQIGCSNCASVARGAHGTGIGYGSFSSLPPTCTLGDVFRLTDGAYDFAACQNVGGSPAWQVYADGVPLTLPSQLGLTSLTNHAGYTWASLIPDWHQGYEQMVANNYGYNGGVYRGWAHGITGPFTIAMDLIPPAFYAVAGAREFSFGFMDANGSRVGIVCGVGTANGNVSERCNVSWYNSIGQNMGSLTNVNHDGSPYDLAGDGTPNGRFSMQAGYDGTNISLAICVRPLGPCTTMYKEAATSHLADVTQLYYGSHWDPGDTTITLYQSSSIWFLGTYRVN